MLRFLLLAFSVLFIFACGDETASIEPETTQTDSTLVAPVLSDAPATLRVDLSSYRLRDAPNQEGKTLAMLERGDRLTHAGATTPNTEAITLRGVRYNEPWLQVRTPTGTEGWVYGGGVSPVAIGQNRIARRLLEDRLRGLFGKSVAQRVLNYHDAFARADSDEALARVYTTGRELVAGPINAYLNNQLDYEALIADAFRRVPELGWLSQALPGYTVGRVAEGTLFQLLEDDRVWLEKARQTTGSADNAYFRLQVALHPVDSIAFGYPAYFMQTWDYGGHSNLGTDLHRTLLRDMDAAYSKGTAFQAQILEQKAALIEDATTYSSYWQPVDAVITELKTIIASDLDILTAADRIALNQRLEQLADPAANGIEVNKRAGE